jgi:hypothetical protein
MKEYSAKYDWINYVHHPSEQKKIQGSKVIEAFNYGLNQSNINLENYDVISKLDADLELPNNYFESIFNEFNENENYGLIGGFVKEQKSNKWINIPSEDYHIRGALKSYRVTCFKEIDGLMPVLGWDGLDEMKLFYNGWFTKNINIGVKHYRPADNDYNSVFLAYRRGAQNYKNGGGVALAIIRSIFRIKNKPYFLLGSFYFWGYVVALLKREEKNVDKNLSLFINKFHFKRALNKLTR